MRVGIFTYGMGHHLTGIGRYTQELSMALSCINTHNEIILINPYPASRQCFFGRFDNYYVPSLRNLPAVLGLGPTILPAIAKKLGLHVFHDPCGISPFLLPRRNKRSARRIVTIHDAVPYVFPHVQPLLTRLTFRTLIPAARRNVDAILTVSESSRQDLIRYVGFAPDQVHVAYQGVSLPSDSELHQIKRDRTALAKWNLDRPYFLYVGALNPRKNVPSLIAAFQQVLVRRPDIKLVLVGPNTWWADDTLRAAERHKNSIVVTGYIRDDELASLYAHAIALVYPSIYEGFGLPPLEAMAHATPVITSNVSSLPEVVGGAGLLIDPSNIDQLAEAMLRLLDTTLSRALSQKGRKRAQQFRWETTAAETLKVYELSLNR